MHPEEIFITAYCKSFNTIFSHSCFSRSSFTRVKKKTFSSVLHNALHLSTVSLSLSLSFALSNKRKQRYCGIGRSLFAKLKRGSLRRLQVVRDILIGISSGWSVRWTKCLYTVTHRDPRKRAYWCILGPLFGEGRRRFLSRACSGSRAFVRLTLNTGFTAW